MTVIMTYDDNWSRSWPIEAHYNYLVDFRYQRQRTMENVQIYAFKYVENIYD